MVGECLELVDLLVVYCITICTAVLAVIEMNWCHACSLTAESMSITAIHEY